MMRLPKSERFWIPESTIAIVGVFGWKCESLSCFQLSALRDSNGQICDEDGRGAGGTGAAALVCTGASGVIESSPTPSWVTRATIWSPARVAATPVIDENLSVICCRRTRSASAESAACAAFAAAWACARAAWAVARSCWACVTTCAAAAAF
jgi:hypothetical protein